jgi:hypothetical protein
MMLHPRAGVIILWEPDCSPQVMTVITSSLWNPSRNTWTEIIENSYNWGYLTMHSFVPCPQLYCLLKPTAHVYTPKMAEDGLKTYSASSQGMSHTV